MYYWLKRLLLRCCGITVSLQRADGKTFKVGECIAVVDRHKKLFMCRGLILGFNEPELVRIETSWDADLLMPIDQIEKIMRYKS